MSNFLAVATVTAALKRLLQAAVGTDVTGANVTTNRPDASSPAGPVVNIYLYQVVPNASLRNNDLPTRSSDGQVLVHRPRVALDLHYLLTFYGAEDEFEPQRLLGSAVRTLHAAPLITDTLIQAVKTAANAAPPVHASLRDSNIDAEVEPVRFIPLSLNFDELSKLWSVFFQTPYALSVAYQASVVLIEPDVIASRALPVLERDVEVRALGAPVIERIEAEGGAGQPIMATTVIELIGQDLAGDVTLVRLAGADRTPQRAGSRRVVLDLATVPIAALSAGTQNVQIVQQTLLGIPPAPHKGRESNTASFVLQPRVVLVSALGSGASGTVAVQVDLTVQPRQQIMLVLLDPPTRTRVGLFAGTPLSAPGTQLSIPITGVATGSYLVQVYVDDAVSPLTVDGAGNVTGPTQALT